MTKTGNGIRDDMEKTKCMIKTKQIQNLSDITIGKNIIVTMQELKYLGVTLDSQNYKNGIINYKAFYDI